jgi:hypothetical protein
MIYVVIHVQLLLWHVKIPYLYLFLDTGASLLSESDFFSILSFLKRYIDHCMLTIKLLTGYL